MDENKITIAVCGESHCAACTEELKYVGSRAHFSQILEDHYGYKVLHFAHGGFSNTGILFQLQEAVKHRPNAIVYHKTWASRITIRTNNQFFPEMGLKNFVYFNPHMVSTHEPWAGNLNAPILSTVVEGLENRSIISPEKIQAVKQYMTELFDYDLQQTLDNWLFEYWHDRIAKAGILPLCFGAEDIGKVAVDFSGADPTFDTPFHTDRATQEQVAANIHRKVIDNLPQIK